MLAAELDRHHRRGAVAQESILCRPREGRAGEALQQGEALLRLGPEAPESALLTLVALLGHEVERNHRRQDHARDDDRHRNSSRGRRREPQSREQHGEGRGGRVNRRRGLDQEVIEGSEG